MWLTRIWTVFAFREAKIGLELDILGSHAGLMQAPCRSLLFLTRAREVCLAPWERFSSSGTDRGRITPKIVGRDVECQSLPRKDQHSWAVLLCCSKQSLTCRRHAGSAECVRFACPWKLYHSTSVTWDILSKKLNPQ